ncbi:hypothetical protein ACRYKS_24940 [Escherichia coli]|uniref:Uncharacterized protein n=1 Tax=Escherichia phage fEgEco12 TaxID=3158837 RepID=A0AAU7PHJ3_9CAUD|nr:hypothetical protein [Escherichia coli]MCU6294861.1 hypothetical protein [Escherichia coli]HCJ9509903.1 hypothetical protein [Escherichia coli]
MKLIIVMMMCLAFPVLATPNLDCTLLRSDGDTLEINTYELFGPSVVENETTYNFKAIDFEGNVPVLTTMTIDKTTLLGRITTQRGESKTFTAKADCNY